MDGGDDDHYHGTHVAGIIGAIDNGVGVVGVAPGARLWAVKVLDKNGSGWSSWIIAGIDWVAANAATIEVANMSLGGSGYSQAEYDAIQGAVNEGVAFAVAAGNSDDDARNYSPAAFDNVLTVSALADFNGAQGGGASPTCRTDQDDTLADFSNWGSAVDIAAPGVCILSTYPIEKGEYGTLSGTSMASPHAAGALALLASVSKPSNASQVYALYTAIKNAGNYNWTDDSGDGIKEPLLDVSAFVPVLIAGGGGGGTTPTNNPPTVNITSPINGDSFSTGTSISFAGLASDTKDGNLTRSLVWTSDLDGQIGTGDSFSTVLSDGTHTITASVTDSGGLTGSAIITITVVGSGGSGINLSVTAYKIKGNKYADLTWSRATSENVDIYRNGSFLAATANDGTHTDGPLGKGGGSATYQICEPEPSSTCSNIVTVRW
jgi:subtilisin family serine protease